jgi:hypothetical protein
MPYGDATEPKRYVSPMFKETAVCQLVLDQICESSPRLRRILNEIKIILNYQSENFIVFIIPNNV